MHLAFSVSDFQRSGKAHQVCDSLWPTSCIAIMVDGYDRLTVPPFDDRIRLPSSVFLGVIASC
jgi:hypothetical protein